MVDLSTALILGGVGEAMQKREERELEETIAADKIDLQEDIAADKIELGQQTLAQKERSDQRTAIVKALEFTNKQIKELTALGVTAKKNGKPQKVIDAIGDQIKSVGAKMGVTIRTLGVNAPPINGKKQTPVPGFTELTATGLRDYQLAIDAQAVQPPGTPKDFRVKIDPETGNPIVDDFGRPEVEPIPGGPKDPETKPISAEVVARLGAMKTSLETFPQIIEQVNEFGELGTVKNVSAMAQHAASIGAPNKADILLTNAIEGALRALTGAAAPQTEVARLKGIWAPTPFDSQSTRRLKLNLLRHTLENMAAAIQTGRATIIPLSEVSATLDAAFATIPKPDAAKPGAAGGVPGRPQSSEAPTPPVDVTTAAQAKELPPGTLFKLPDGSVKVR